VYSLNWSSDDHYLLSASADQTARVWDVRNQIIQHVEVNDIKQNFHFSYEIIMIL